MKAIIYSKDVCPYCVQAKRILELKEIPYEEKILGRDYTREELLDIAPGARTVPQIFIDDNRIGGFTELRNYLGM